MRDPILIGNGDAAPDVCWLPDGSGWCVAWVPIGADGVRQKLRIEFYSPMGDHRLTTEIFTGTTAGGTQPRFSVVGGRIYLIHRALVDTLLQATLREIFLDGTFGTIGWYGRADGPMAITQDWFGWQDIPANLTYGRPLHGVDRATQILRRSTVGTGLAYLDATWPVTVDENRLRIPGMYNPVRSSDLIVGEALSGGIAVRLGGAVGVLRPWEITGTPRGAVSSVGGPYAAVCWGGPGVRLFLFSRADVLASLDLEGAL